MADWFDLLTKAAIPLGGLVVGFSTYWSSRQSRRAEKARAQSEAAEVDKRQALERAKEQGRREAEAAAEAQRAADLLSSVEQANHLMGSPEDMARWRADVDQRLHALDGKGISGTFHPVTARLLTPERTSEPTTPAAAPTGRRRV